MIDVPTIIPISYDAAFAMAMNEAKQQGYKPRDACIVARQTAASVAAVAPTSARRSINQVELELVDPRVAVDTYNARP